MSLSVLIFGGLLDMLAFYQIFVLYRIFFAESFTLTGRRIACIGGISYCVSLICVYWNLPVSAYVSMLIVMWLFGKRKVWESILILPAFMSYVVLAIVPVLMVRSMVTIPIPVILSPYDEDWLGIGLDLLLCVGLTALYRMLRKHKLTLKLRPVEAAGFVLFFFFEIFLLMVIAVIRTQYEGMTQLLLNGCCLFFFMLALGAYLWHLITLRRVARLDMLVKQEDDYIRCQLSYLEQYKNENQSIRALRHDLRGHLQMLQSLQESNQKRKTEDYLESLQAETERIRELEFTGNQAADIVLSNQKKRAQEAGISFVCEGTLPWLDEMKPMEVCSLLSNLLDNAYDASMREKEPDISVIGGVREHFWTLTVSNRSEKECRIHNNRMPSTKGGHHGMGLGIVEQIVEKYGGICRFAWEDQRFVCQILIPRVRETETRTV